MQNLVGNRRKRVIKRTAYRFEQDFRSVFRNSLKRAIQHRLCPSTPFEKRARKTCPKREGGRFRRRFRRFRRRFCTFIARFSQFLGLGRHTKSDIRLKSCTKAASLFVNYAFCSHLFTNRSINSLRIGVNRRTACSNRFSRSVNGKTATLSR